MAGRGQEGARLRGKETEKERKESVEIISTLSAVHAHVHAHAQNHS